METLAAATTDAAKDLAACIGPVQNEVQFNKLMKLIDDAKAVGHDFVVGGQDSSSATGFFIQPTIVRNPPSDSRIVQEENFGA